MSILGLAFLLYTVVLTSVCRKLLIFEQKKMALCIIYDLECVYSQYLSPSGM